MLYIRVCVLYTNEIEEVASQFTHNRWHRNKEYVLQHMQTFFLYSIVFE